VIASIPVAPSSPFELRHASTGRALFINVPERRLLAIHGRGTRGADDFRLATAVLRTVADLVRRPQGHAARVQTARAVLEVTWPIDGSTSIDEILEALARPEQAWRQLIELPANVSDGEAISAIELARRLSRRDVQLVHVERMREGPAAQILHLSNEPLSGGVRKLLGHAVEAGARPFGHVHELILADPMAVGLDRGRSILRVPIAAVGR
jgi:hypothetical protein